MVFEESQADFQQSESLVLAKLRFIHFFLCLGATTGAFTHLLDRHIVLVDTLRRQASARRIIIAP